MDGPSPALAGLNPAQAQAVSLTGGPVLVIAGAGTGKTRTLTHRVAWLAEQGELPQSILLLTFTRRAAQEMLQRARSLNPACQAVAGGTFHSLCHRLLRAHGERLGLARSFTVIDPADCQQIIKGVVDEHGLKPSGEKRFPKARTIADIISKHRNLEMGLADAVESFWPQLDTYTERLATAARAFMAAKRAQGLVDYDDLLFLTEELLGGHPDLRGQLTDRWRHLLVDEYQDTNAVQGRLVKLLTGTEKNVMAVGDDAQSIYAFRGARLANILEFPQTFPGTRLVKLEQNYRSSQPILELTNAVISAAKRSYHKRLFSEIAEGPRPELVTPRDQRGQSQEVAGRVRRLLEQGASPAKIAVLFRAGRDSFDLETELKASRVAFVKYGGIRFEELAHVKDVLAHLRVVVNPGDFLAWQRMLMLIPGVGPKTAQQIIAHLVAEGSEDHIRRRLATAPQGGRFAALGELADLLQAVDSAAHDPVEAVELVLEYYEPSCREMYEDYPRRLKDLAELPGLAGGSENLAEFLAEVVLEPEQAAQPAPAGGHPLTLSTVHSAKGKEWDHVLVLWAADGRFPAFPSLDDQEALEEELRLFYVACTRAAKSLTLLAPREHYFEGAGWRPVPPTRFLDEVPEGLIQTPEAGAVFPVEEPAPVSRGSRRQDRPHAVGALVRHHKFGRGKVMGYQGGGKIIVYFEKVGLKILLMKYAELQAE